MAKVIILNGAPGIGKDTIACHLADDYSMLTASFKKPMFDIAKAMLGEIGYEQFIALYENRNTKESPTGLLGGKSPREFMIWISEVVIKPVFGNGYFGRIASDDVELCQDLVPGFTFVFSDGGFAAEVCELVERGHEVHLIRLHRSGFEFVGDSRSHIHIDPAQYLPGRYTEYDLKLHDGFPKIAAKEIVDMVFNK